MVVVFVPTMPRGDFGDGAGSEVFGAGWRCGLSGRLLGSEDLRRRSLRWDGGGHFAWCLGKLRGTWCLSHGSCLHVKQRRGAMRGKKLVRWTTGVDGAGM
jgi:hypothetical protein